MSLRSRLGKGIASAGLIAGDALSKYFASQQQAEQQATENAQEERRLKIAEELGAFNLKKGASDLASAETDRARVEADRAQTEAETAEKKRLAGLEVLGQSDISALGMEKVSKPAPIAAGFDRAAPRTEISPEEFAGRFQGERDKLTKGKRESELFTMAAGASGSLPSKTSQSYLEGLQTAEAPELARQARKNEIADLKAAGAYGRAGTTGTGADLKEAELELKRLELEKKQKEASLGKTPSENTIQTMSELANFPTMLAGLSSTIKENADVMGPVSGRLSTAMGAAGLTNESTLRAQKLNAKYEAVKQVVAKAMEGGVLRKEDMPKYEKILGSIKLSPEAAEQNIRELESMLTTAYNNYYDGLKNSGYNVSGFSRIEPKGAESSRQLSSEDQEALDWANKNSSDPRAAAIKKRLGK